MRNSPFFSPIIAGATVLLFAIVVTSTFREGYVLPAHDPIAIPMLAQAVAAWAFRGAPWIGSFYPPGLPAIFAPIAQVAGTLHVAHLLKLVSLSAVCLLPLTWAWLLHELTPSRRTPFGLVAVCSYVAFFLIERTMLFGVAFAGKTAVIIAIAAAPLVILLLLRAARSWKWVPLASVASIGLVLVHYSMLHLVTALLASIVLVSAVRARRIDVLELARLTIPAVLAIAVVLLCTRVLGYDGEAAASGVYAPLPALGHAIQDLIAQVPVYVIYGTIDSGMLVPPFRGLMIIGALLLTFAASRLAGVPSVFAAAVTAFAAFVILLAFGENVLPAQISLDFARWIMWPVVALLFAAFLLALVETAFSRERVLANGAILCLVIILAATAPVVYRDRAVFRQINAAQALEEADLVAMRERLSGDRCWIISDSVETPGVGVIAQRSRMLDYAEIATDCLFLNGGWIGLYPDGGRELDGKPSAGLLQGALLDGDEIYFAGPHDVLARYVSATGMPLTVSTLPALRDGTPVSRLGLH